MKLWGGRFEKTTDGQTDVFHSSIFFDKRLYNEDIIGSIAHAEMLAERGIIPESDAKVIIDGLNALRVRIAKGEIEFDPAAEDIHMNIEKLLIEEIGEPGKRLHTARSRNDQVALDMKLYARGEIAEIKALIKALIQTLWKKASENVGTIMPGHTHMQKAQPVTLAHHLSAYIEMLRRDYERVSKIDLGECPLGAGALATTTYPIDRLSAAKKLGFESVMKNSMDAVSDRDYCIELLSALSILMMHLSRFCEEIIIWNTDEFKFIELDDAYSTGSSIMPQKKNPDMAELVRGKTGRVYGDLFALLTVMKGLPLAYNKDMQEDKEAFFDAVDTIKICLPVFTGMVETFKINKDRMRQSAGLGFTNATDAADWLVKKGVPFRDAHEIIGRLVLYAVKSGKNLEQLSLEEYKGVSGVFDASVFEALKIESCVERRSAEGGPSPKYMEEYLQAVAEYIKGLPDCGD